MSDTPKEIWLTKDDEQSYLWSQDKIDTGDIAYTRDDIVEQKLATMREALERIIGSVGDNGIEARNKARAALEKG